MLRKVFSLFSFSIINCVLLSFLLAPALTHATSESENNHTAITQINLSKQEANPDLAPSDKTNLRSAVISTKTRRNLLKLVAMIPSLYHLCTDRTLTFKKDPVVTTALYTWIISLAQSIFKDYKTPIMSLFTNKSIAVANTTENNTQQKKYMRYANTIMHRTLILLKLIGTAPSGFLLLHASPKEEPAFSILVFGNTLFLGHSLYGDYTAYASTKQSDNNMHSTDLNNQYSNMEKSSQTS